jgi:tetratricopeptide (TPR) repeat protein
MAKKQNQSARTTLEEVNESLTSAAQRIEDNKKYVNWALIGIAIIALLAGGWIYLHNKNEADAKEAYGKAYYEWIQGNSDEALKKFEQVADEYGNRFGNVAHLNAAILLSQKEKYPEALKHLEKYDPEGDVVGPESQSLMGDCYVNLKKYPEALSCYDKAISLAKGNESYAPLFMIKKATVLHEQQKYAEEAAIYQDIKDNYFAFTQQSGFSVDKYLERALELAGK